MKNTKRTVLALLCLFVICVASSPSDPSPRTDEYWVETHALFKANTANNPDIPILFYGDSIMRRWIEDGRDVFYQYYEPVGVVNYGMGGEGIQNVLWRILNGEIRGLNPKLVVLKIGTNNLGNLHNLQFLELNKSIYKEYGSICKLPALFGKPDIVMFFDPKDIENVFRNEGRWPFRRSLETFGYYRQKVRPDIFKTIGGLVNDQGEEWSKLRTAVNPIMMKPKVAKVYIPDIDTVAKDFVAKIKTLRDDKNELPDDFQNELNKWSLESIALIAIEHRLGLLAGEMDSEMVSL